MNRSIITQKRLAKTNIVVSRCCVCGVFYGMKSAEGVPGDFSDGYCNKHLEQLLNEIDNIKKNTMSKREAVHILMHSPFYFRSEEGWKSTKKRLEHIKEFIKF